MRAFCSLIKLIRNINLARSGGQTQIYHSLYNGVPSPKISSSRISVGFIGHQSQTRNAPRYCYQYHDILRSRKERDPFRRNCLISSPSSFLTQNTPSCFEASPLHVKYYVLAPYFHLPTDSFSSSAEIAMLGPVKDLEQASAAVALRS